jgi:hypothetical protein
MVHVFAIKATYVTTSFEFALQGITVAYSNIKCMMLVVTQLSRHIERF